MACISRAGTAAGGIQARYFCFGKAPASFPIQKTENGVSRKSDPRVGALKLIIL